MNENVLVAWVRKSKNGDKIVLNVNRDAIKNCSVNMGRVKLVMNTNKIVGMIQDKVDVCAANHIVNNVETKIEELKLKYEE